MSPETARKRTNRQVIWGEVWNELWTAAARRRFLSLRGRGVTLPLLSLCWQHSGRKKESGVEPPQSKALAAADPRPIIRDGQEKKLPNSCQFPAPFPHVLLSEPPSGVTIASR
jgi:hypothetical protein